MTGADKTIHDGLATLSDEELAHVINVLEPFVLELWPGETETRTYVLACLEAQRRSGSVRWDEGGQLTDGPWDRE